MKLSRQRGRVVMALAATAVVPLLFLVREELDPSRSIALCLGLVFATLVALAVPELHTSERSARLTTARARLRRRTATLHEDATRDRRVVEGAQRDREEFLAAVSHELRTPLNSIQGFTQVLLSEIEGPLSESQREDVDAIAVAGAFLKGLVDEVLDASSEPSAVEASREPIDLAPIVREIVKLLAGQHRAASIAITSEIAAELPRVRADPRRIRQILSNLGGNAVKFTLTGSVHVRAWAEPDVVLISVEDTGPGIPAGELERVFSAFERVDATRGRAEGWGLGLAIAREMAQWHGGRIDVVSEVGRGSTFTLVLPRRGEETR